MSSLLTTFDIAGNQFALEVLAVQEVTGTPIVIPVPLAPNFVNGLINLRGQLATALELRELFQLSNETFPQAMSVVCRIDGNLVSLMVDHIGDVVEPPAGSFEPPPDSMPPAVRKYVKGVYKMPNGLLSLLDLEKIAQELSPEGATA